MFKLLQIDATDPQKLTTDLQLAFELAPATLLIVTGNFASMQALRNVKEPERYSANWIGCSSCIGAASSLGVDQRSDRRLSLLCIDDPTGGYGVASGPQIEGQVIQIAADVVQMAIQRANRLGELPSLIWCMQAPGFEEQIITGIQQVVGDQVPIVGASAADDQLTGDWCQYDGQQLSGNSLVIAVLYPTVAINNYSSSGYSAEGHNGVVTEVIGRRITKIDHQNPLEVYNGWLQRIAAPIQVPCHLLRECTFYPLGRQLLAKDTEFYLLSLPISIHPDGSIETFSEIQPGDVITLMSGEKEQLIRRASHVVRVASNNLRLRHNQEPAAALIVYCAAGMLAVGKDFKKVQQSLEAGLPDIPYLVVFSFGEQGCFADGLNRHGNLMMTAVLFGQPYQECRS